MVNRPSTLAGIIALGTVGILTLCRCPAAETPQMVPEASVPALDGAALHLAQGRLKQAQNGFEDLVRDTTQTSFVRALAQLGLAKTYWAQQDRAHALSI